MSLRFNNAPMLSETFSSIPLPPQQRPSQFIVDLEPKVINSFNFSNTIRPHNINYKQPSMVEITTSIPKNVYGSSAFAPRILPPMKANNFI
tara:strand:- start:1252 stop:1524 length:273 start_codon:yes stop_codon:yes gene_type:complete